MRLRAIECLSLLVLAGCQHDAIVGMGTPPGDDLGVEVDLQESPPPDLDTRDLVPCQESTEPIAHPPLPMAIAAPTLLGKTYSLLLTSADLDGDGAIDLIESAVGSVQVRFGRPGGEFDAPVKVWSWANLAEWAEAAAVGDFDGDKRPDLVITVGDERQSMGSRSSVTIVCNEGKRQFRAPSIRTLAWRPGALATGDFDKDGHLDVAVARAPSYAFAGQTVDVFLGAGDGTLASSSSTSLGKHKGGRSLIVADFTGDGRLDVATDAYGYYSSNKLVGSGVLLMAGLGDGTLGAPSLVALPWSVTSLTVGDFTGDGTLDLAVTTYAGDRDTSSERVAVLPGRGDGTFSAALVASVGGWPGELAAADLDADGVLDLVVTQYGGPDLTVLRGSGNGTFAAPRRFVTGELAGHLNLWDTVGVPPRAADFDGDGRLDVALSGYVGSVILFGSGDGNLRSGTSHDAGGGQGLAVADFDRDGRLDFATTTYEAVAVSFGGSLPHQRRLVPLPSPLAPRGLTSADFNGDGFSDLAVAEAGSYDYQMKRWVNSGAGILLGAGDGTFFPDGHYPTEEVPSTILNADFNGDHIADLATLHFDADTVSVLLGVGDGSFTVATHHAVGAGASSFAAADLDGDGHIDLLVAHYDRKEYEGGAALLSGDGRGGFHPSREIFGSDRVRVALAGDVNGDGRADAVLLISPTTVLVLLARCDGTFDQRPRQLGDPNAGPDFFLTAGALADLDGNGVPDLVVARPRDDPPYARCYEICASRGISILPAIGDGRFGPRIDLPAGHVPDAFATPDLDGDGRLDLVVLNAGTYSIYRNPKP